LFLINIKFPGNRGGETGVNDIAFHNFRFRRTLSERSRIGYGDDAPMPVPGSQELEYIITKFVGVHDNPAGEDHLHFSQTMISRH
jgi:hypothetical protein